jgi:hypothetical protein
LQSISGSIEGTLPENTASWQALASAAPKAVGGSGDVNDFFSHWASKNPCRVASSERQAPFFCDMRKKLDDFWRISVPTSSRLSKNGIEVRDFSLGRLVKNPFFPESAKKVLGLFFNVTVDSFQSGRVIDEGLQVTCGCSLMN